MEASLWFLFFYISKHVCVVSLFLIHLRACAQSSVPSSGEEDKCKNETSEPAISWQYEARLGINIESVCLSTKLTLVSVTTGLQDPRLECIYSTSGFGNSCLQPWPRQLLMIPWEVAMVLQAWCVQLSLAIRATALWDFTVIWKFVSSDLVYRY